MITTKAKARTGLNRIVVDDCPIGEGQRMTDCFAGEYWLDFDADPRTLAQVNLDVWQAEVAAPRENDRPF
jgi:hypothetical protein